jgi:hypothetical protein
MSVGPFSGNGVRAFTRSFLDEFARVEHEVNPLDAAMQYRNGLHSVVIGYLERYCTYFKELSLEQLIAKVEWATEHLEDHEKLTIKCLGLFGGKAQKQDAGSVIKLDDDKAAGELKCFNCNGGHRIGNCNAKCTKCRVVPCGMPPSRCPVYLAWKKTQSTKKGGALQLFTPQLSKPLYRAHNVKMQIEEDSKIAAVVDQVIHGSVLQNVSCDLVADVLGKVEDRLAIPVVSKIHELLNVRLSGFAGPDCAGIIKGINEVLHLLGLRWAGLFRCF